MSILTRFRKQDPAPLDGRTEAPEEDGPRDEITARWERVLAANPDKAEAVLHVLERYAQTDHARFETLAGEVDDRFRDHRRIQMLIARHYLQTGRDDVALQRWQAIEERYPDQHESANRLAYLHLRAGRHEETLRFADILEERHGQLDKAARLRARVHQRLNDPKAEADCWRTVLELVPDDSEAMTRIVSTGIDGKDFAAALENVESFLETSPDNADLLSLRCRVLMRLDRHEEALEATTSLIESGAANRALFSDQAHLLYRLNRYDEAEAVCADLLESDPDDIRALTLHARIAQARFARSKVA